jgi:hypothetical protein
MKKVGTLLTVEKLTTQSVCTKNLSQYSINAYKALYEGVRTSFEVVYATIKETSKVDHLTPVCQVKYATPVKPS